MCSVKVYDTDTGHVQTVSEGLTPAEAETLLSGLNAEDHGTETVFYVSREADDWDRT